MLLVNRHAKKDAEIRVHWDDMGLPACTTVLAMEDSYLMLELPAVGDGGPGAGSGKPAWWHLQQLWHHGGRKRKLRQLQHLGGGKPRLRQLSGSFGTMADGCGSSDNSGTLAAGRGSSGSGASWQWIAGELEAELISRAVGWRRCWIDRSSGPVLGLIHPVERAS